jgi:hypothetical protein
MALVKAYTDASGTEHPASYWRAVQLNIGSLDGSLHCVFYGWRDASAHADGLRPLADAARSYTLTGGDFLSMAGAPPVGDSLYLVLANASEDYVLANDPFFAGAVQV